MKKLRTAERALLILGVVLFACCAIAYLYGGFRARMALRKFHYQLTRSYDLPHSRPPLPANVDVTLWSGKRIEDYEESLAQHFDSPLGVLQISRIHLEAPVFEGTDDVTLNRGVGRIPGTARLGDTGNVGIAGHRDGFFRRLKDIAPADEVQLVTASGTHTYVVDSLRIVNPEDVNVLVSNDVPSVTLVTCYPFYFVGSAPKRFIVHATMQASQSQVNRRVQITSAVPNMNSQEKTQ